MSPGVPFDFPDNPTLDQEVTAVGGIVYVWDGIKWISGVSPTVYLPIAGGTMTGPLILARDPQLPMEAATMQWVQSYVAANRTLPAGANTQIQFHGGGTPPVFAASANLTFASNVLAVRGPGRILVGQEYGANSLDLAQRFLSGQGHTYIATNYDPLLGSSGMRRQMGQSAWVISAITSPDETGSFSINWVDQSFDLLRPVLYIEDAENNRIGLGNTNPQWALDVQGDINIRSTTGQAFRINGVPLSFSPAGANGQVQFNNAGVFGASANLFWDNSNSRLGIGTVNPDMPLHVYAFGGTGAILHVQGEGGTPADAVIQGTSSVVCLHMISDISHYIITTPGSLIPGRAGSFCVLDELRGVYAMAITAAGNLGIDTLTPAYRLDVNGDCNLSTGHVYRINGVPLSFPPAGVNGQIQFNDNGVFGASNLYWNPATAQLGVGTHVTAYPVDIVVPPTAMAAGLRLAAIAGGVGRHVAMEFWGTAGDGSLYNTARIEAGFQFPYGFPDTSLFFMTGSSYTVWGTVMTLRGFNVGIGTTTPIQRLEVQGPTWGPPAAGGAGADGTLRVMAFGHGECLDMGTGAGVAWLQSRNSANYASNFGLMLNPNGGNVGINKVPGFPLDISGDCNITGTYRVNGAAVSFSIDLENAVKELRAEVDELKRK